MPHHFRFDVSRNQLLAVLPEDDAERLLSHSKIIHYQAGTVLFRSQDPATFIYFPQGAVLSLMSFLEEGRAVELALVGSEGLVDVWPALGAYRYRYEAVIQVSGPCLQIHSAMFRAVMLHSRKVREQLESYTRYLLSQVSLTAACNRVHRLEQRIARRLLMTRERLDRDEFPATHEFLSSVLGSDRSEISVAAGALRNAGLISYRYGTVSIVDVQGLEGRACECYRNLNRELNDYHYELRGLYPPPSLQRHGAPRHTVAADRI